MKLPNRKNPVMASWLRELGSRLDAQPFLSGAIEARKALERLDAKKVPLKSLTAGHAGGIYNGPQFRRNYVDSPEYGVPFLTSGSMLLADLSTLPLLSTRDANSAKLSYLRLEEGMTLVSCSGTIGRTAYCRPEMNGIWSSQDVLKVVPDPKKIPPGYLYAYLSCRFGLPIVISGTYGSIIQHLEPEHIVDLPVPRLGTRLELTVHDLVDEAATLRTRAAGLFGRVQGELRRQLGEPQVEKESTGKAACFGGHWVSSVDLQRTSRFEGFFHNPHARTIDHWIEGHGHGYWTLREIATVFDVPPFKHIYVESANGVPFYTSGDIFLLDRKPRLFLSRQCTKGLDKYIIERGWILLARSGQLGGIIGRPQFVDSAMQGSATSDHVIRIVPRNPEAIPPGYLYAYLSMPSVGYPLVTRTIAGKPVPALWPEYLNDVRVVKAEAVFMARVDHEVRRAFELRVKATRKEDEAKSRVEEAIS